MVFFVNQCPTKAGAPPTVSSGPCRQVKLIIGKKIKPFSKKGSAWQATGQLGKLTLLIIMCSSSPEINIYFDCQSVLSVQEGMGQKICARTQLKILSETVVNSRLNCCSAILYTLEFFSKGPQSISFTQSVFHSPGLPPRSSTRCLRCL